MTALLEGQLYIHLQAYTDWLYIGLFFCQAIFFIPKIK